MKTLISYATKDDFSWLQEHEIHISPEKLKQKISSQEIIIAKNGQKTIGWLRFSYIWEMMPFAEILMITEEYRRKGIGKMIMEFWETEMKKQKHKLVMTSTQDNEEGQYFYRKIGYKDAGKISGINDDNSDELFLTKKINIDK